MVIKFKKLVLSLASAMFAVGSVVGVGAVQAGVSQSTTEEKSPTEEEVSHAILVLEQAGAVDADDTAQALQVKQSVLERLREKKILDTKSAAGGNLCGDGGL